MTNDGTHQSWRLRKAERFLMAAERAFEAEDWETVASRSYYAVYHSMIALLEARTDLTTPRRHTQFHNLLRSRLVASVFTSQDASDALRLYVARQAADYDDDTLDEKRAEDSLKEARLLCGRISGAM